MSDTHILFTLAETESMSDTCYLHGITRTRVLEILTKWGIPHDNSRSHLEFDLEVLQEKLKK